MILFLMVFLSFYGGMHLYVWLRLRSLVAPGAGCTAWMTMMTCAPLLVRLLERYGWDRAALWIAWPSYIWMGGIFLFSVVLLTLDLARLVLLATGVGRRKQSRFPAPLSAATCCAAALALACISSAYALYEAQQIRTERITITSSRLPAGTPPRTIVQLSDVHLGLLFREQRLERVLQAVRSARPDILVSTGDLVDGRLAREDAMQHRSSLAGMLAAVPAPLGRYAVIGNHEHYVGIEQSLDYTRSAGFTVLQDQAVSLPNGITILGVNDQGRVRIKDGSASPGEQSLLAQDHRGFRLLLKHRPLVPAASDGRFDLQLSGHTHKGQLLPFYPLTWLEYPFRSGTTRTARGAWIHVSRGSGTWGPPMRFLAPPEVTVITIRPEA